MKYLYIIGLVLIAFLLYTCSDEGENPQIKGNPPLKIAVFTDNHYFDESLGSGQVFDAYCRSENKLVAESQSLNNALFNNILAEDCNVVLVCGDLTNNGEKANHLIMREKLRQLQNTGKKVYVIPGNHDINNPYANKYDASGKSKTEIISAEDFENIYNEFGYSSAFSRDENSLSYSANLDSSTVLLALDACKYENYTTNYAISSGKLKAGTIEWMKGILHNAKQSKKRIIAMLHHGLVEHFTGQAANPISSDYVLDNATDVVSILADSGVSAVFTGHFHANDISQYRSNSGKTIYDLETGSVLTYPHSYRLITLTDTKLSVITKNITNVVYKNISDFNVYSKDKTKSLLENYFNSYWGTFTNRFPDTYSQETKDLVKKSFVSAVLAHYIGDEVINTETQNAIQTLAASGNTGLSIIAYMMQTIYTDLEPKDRNIELIINK